jgi:hypothetical protein
MGTNTQLALHKFGKKVGQIILIKSKRRPTSLSWIYTSISKEANEWTSEVFITNSLHFPLNRCVRV